MIDLLKFVALFCGTYYGLSLILWPVDRALERRKDFWQSMIDEGKQLEQIAVRLAEESSVIEANRDDPWINVAIQGFNDDLADYKKRKAAWQEQVDQGWWRIPDSHRVAGGGDHK